MNHASSRNNIRHAAASLAVVIALAMLISACGVDSASIDTVDNAVTLLQDIEDAGSWTVISDGLDLLDDYDGYRAVVTLNTSPLDADGNATTSSEATVTITIQVDADGAIHYSIEQADGIQYFIALPADSGSEPESSARIYEQNDDSYICADESLVTLLKNGTRSIFEAYAFKHASLATLSVAADDGERVIINRDATHYLLESRLAEALDILDATDHSALREQVEQSDTITFTGTLDLDDDTGALLYLDAGHTDTSTQERTSVIFEITQWGDIAALNHPPASLLPACD